MNRLTIENLKVGYGDVEIIHDLSHVLPDKKITTIIGSNGCGKSTLLKSIARIIPYQGGNICFDNESIHREQTKVLAQKMALLSQKQPSMEGITVEELVAYGRFPHQKKFSTLNDRDHQMIDWALKKTEIDPFRNQDINALSGGQLQRVWIAMALVQDTDYILLDEPTTYLDMAHQMEVLELLKRLNLEQEKTIVMVLHDINQAARFSDYLIAMKDGAIVKAGACEDVMTKEVLKHVFSIKAHMGTDPLTHKPMCISYTI